ncbi:methyltransferase domain-containing protein [Lentimicrobium sp.]|uniref:spermidine synthase n=1 Tax=Lentimicrobium sp. TaxID=2034841 RepID=UPI002C67CA8F|nr:methyltransferase domain-containing protein [Lentimicrobium sp.]HPF64253.1 methyltransferase domain-containing protein [Lentimicrobium sp.]
MRISRDAFRYLSSFAGEQIIEQYAGDVNPVIEVALVNGRYQLNAESVNYSYGPLHDAFRKYFRLDPPELDSGDQVLILGFGAGSVAVILREELGLQQHITGVELDGVVLQVGREHFNIERLPALSIIKDDALTFVDSCPQNYQLIIVDLYLDRLVPPQFEKETFIRSLQRLLTPGGKVVFNKFAGTPALEAEATALEKRFAEVFSGTCTFRIRVNKRAPNLMITGVK